MINLIEQFNLVKIKHNNQVQREQMFSINIVNKVGERQIIALDS